MSGKKIMEKRPVDFSFTDRIKDEYNIQERLIKWDEFCYDYYKSNNNITPTNLLNIFHKLRTNVENGVDYTNLLCFSYTSEAIENLNDKIALACVRKHIENGLGLEEIFVTTLEEAIDNINGRGTNKSRKWLDRFRSKKIKVYVILNIYPITLQQMIISGKKFFGLLSLILKEDNRKHCYLSLRNPKENIDYIYADSSRIFYKKQFVYYKN